MSSIRILTIGTAALLLVAGPPAIALADAPQSKSMLWKVSSEQGSLHILGSVHAVSTDFYPMSEAIERAYDGADFVVFEVDLGKMPEAAIAMLKQGTLPDGKVLEDVVSSETYKLAEEHLGGIGLNISFFKNMEPWLLALTATAFEFQKAGFSMDNGIDQHFFSRAVEDEKRVEALETIDFQIGLFADLVGDKGEEFLLYSLQELESMLPLLEEITTAWKTGDAEALDSLLTKAFADHPELFRTIVTERNRQWLGEIRKMLADGSPGLVVVGSLHLVGEEGLVTLLEAAGYTVEQE